MSTSMTKTNCGCGRNEAGDCGAGLPVCTDTNFKRPRFFAGQLLTEDDLQALSDYVVGKNRLHNRFLFGDGVVCGLSVTCHPCDKGHVSVAPGFALDCCGNDILVPCKEDLDVNALLRDLRKRQLAGYDCGDPCAEDDPDDKHYGLYLKYTETLEDQVAPYISDDPCGQQACEPTRVCEGYRFELRCDCKNSARADVFKRILACFGDLKQAAAAFSKAQAIDLQAERLQVAVRAIKAETPIPFGKDSIQALSEVTQELAKLNKIRLDKDLDEQGLPKFKPDERSLRLDVARLQILTGAITRFRALLEKERKDQQEELQNVNVDLAALLKNAKDTIEAASQRVEILSPAVMKTPSARTEADASVQLARKYVVEDLPDEKFATAEAKLVALNQPFSFHQLQRMKIDATLLRDWLLDKLADSTSLTRCDLYDRVRSIRIDAVADNTYMDELAEIETSSQATKALVRILIEYLIDCVCLALNPPCQPCEDQGVLLACITTRNCEVIDICNMSRRYVLTPVAMRYWLPPVGWIGKLVNKLCCESDLRKLLTWFAERFKDRTPKDTVERLVTTPPEEAAIAKTYTPLVPVAEIDEDSALVLKQLHIEPRDFETFTAFSTNLALLSARAVALDPVAIAKRGAALSETLFGRPREMARRAPLDEHAVRATVADLVGKEVAVAQEGLARYLDENIARSLDSLASGMRAELAEGVMKEVGGTLEKELANKAKSAVGRELSAAKVRSALQGSDAFKALKAENRNLAGDLKTLATAVEKLQAGGNA